MFRSGLIARARRQAGTRLVGLGTAGICVIVMSGGCGVNQPSADSSTTSAATSSAPRELSATDLGEEMEATCADFDAHVDPLIGRLIRAGAATPEEMATVLDGVAGAARDQLAQLRSLDPPVDQRDSYGRYIAALERAATQIEGSIGVAGFDDVFGEGIPSPFFAAEAAADQMGIHGSCGSGESQADDPLSPDQLRDATQVEVVASEYQWSGIPRTLEPGPTVFAFRNDGEELHELFIVQLVDGIEPDSAIETALAQLEAGRSHTETPPEHARRLGVARGGPNAVATLDANLTPGTYIVICFLPDAQGISHARHGMATWFEVTP